MEINEEMNSKKSVLVVNPTLIELLLRMSDRNPCDERAYGNWKEIIDCDVIHNSLELDAKVEGCVQENPHFTTTTVW